MKDQLEDTGTPVIHESAVTTTAKEVYDYVREKLAPTVEEERAKVEKAMNATIAIGGITNPEQYKAANDARRELNKAIKDGKIVLSDWKKKAHSVWKAFTSSENEIILEKKAEAEVIRIGRLTSAYDQEQERIRKEEQRKAEAAAKKAAEEQALKEAQELADAGDKEAAEAVLDAPVAPAPVEIAKSTPELDDTHYRDNWKVESIDASKLSREYMMPDTVKINKMVKTWKGDTNIPGVKVWNDRKPVDRG